MHLFLVLMLFISCSHKVNIVAPVAPNTREQYEATGKKHIITSQGDATSKAADEMFDKGGNIIDAFVAASFTISVERPHSTGLGGGGFLLYFSQKDNKVYAFDFREVAPLRAYSKMYLSKKGESQPLLSQEGALAVATPGLVYGLYEIHKRFGKLPWKETLVPAIRLAREGLTVYPQLNEAIKDRKDILKLDPDAKKIFFTEEGNVPEVGAVIHQELLAKTLELIAKKGRKGFYKGKVADSIVKTVQKKRGILTHKDLRTYEMKERTPVTGFYKGNKIFSMPPPSSGGIHVIQILKMLEPYNLKSLGPQTTEAVHLTAMSMQRAFQDRAFYLGDPDFNNIPVKGLLNEEYLKTLSKEINKPVIPPANELEQIKLPYESTDTTHFTIGDQYGNLVASTQTINGWFGSGVMALGTGIVLNNEMDDFAQKVGASNLFGAVGGKNNLVEPRKRPLSSMSPTIVLNNDKPVMALGSPSGTRIITCVAQTILNSLEYEMPLYEAVAATRIHQQWQPDVLKVEEPFLRPEVEKELSKRGHSIVHERLGCSIQAVKREGDGWIGVSDPRGAGRALGE